jgi:CheY-like chemotaxis protein
MARIVIADDDDDVRTLVERILGRAGHTVIATRDGAEALQAVRADRPELVVSDIDMPGMSGVELCLALRGDLATSQLAVLLVSGSLAPGDARPTDAQATACLHKPFTTNELLGCVETLLQTGHHIGQEPTPFPE